MNMGIFRVFYEKKELAEIEAINSDDAIEKISLRLYTEDVEHPNKNGEYE